MPLAGRDGDRDSDSDSSSSDYGWDRSLEEHVQTLVDEALRKRAAPAPPFEPPFELPFEPPGPAAAAHAVASLSRGPSVAPGLGATPARVAADEPRPALDAALVFVDAQHPHVSPLGEPVDGDRVWHDAKPARGKDRGVDAPPQDPPGSSLDPASPLARFRTYPKKALNVSDLTSGAWCELQYEYTLTRLPGGRRTRTPAMRAGSKVHETLEEEVHVVVPVPVASAEDAMAVRLWNMAEGLRTLRTTGLTREFAMWGVLDLGPDCPGPDRYQVVNGIIDALSCERPTPTGLPAVQPIGPADAQARRAVYITDVKTRASTRLPSGAAVRTTQMQLFLYHRFLGDLAARRLDFDRVFARFRVDPDAPLSAELQGELALPSGALPANLRGVLGSLVAEVDQTFPRGAASVGDVVAVEYRQRPQDGGSDAGAANGRLLGTSVMPVDPALLDRYLASYLGWWRGARPAVGVAIEEAALKCSYCEFADECAWRRALDDERMAKARARVAAARAARAARGPGESCGP